ncbi:MAG: hypothetical protein RIQ89_1633 [Bacteroidota bacterium]
MKLKSLLQPLALLVLHIFYFTSPVSAQLILNEVTTSNQSIVADDEGDFEDYIEIFNAGTQAVSLEDYFLSDEKEHPLKYQLPSITIPANGYQTIFCSSKNKVAAYNFWRTAIDQTDTLTYFVGVSEPDPTWITQSYNDSSWLMGKGSIGYGDGDDSTVISSTISLYIRKSFFCSDTTNILNALLHLDFDDAFIAYLNGVEVARYNMGNPGDFYSYNTPSNATHEATMYQGLPPEPFVIDANTINSLLVPGENILALQVHNNSIFSPDMSMLPFLSFEFSQPSNLFSSTPTWFPFPNGGIYVHSNFSLSPDESVYLRTSNKELVSKIELQQLNYNTTLQSIPDGSGNYCIAQWGTPSLSNNFTTCYTALAESVSFSPAGGKYAAPISVSLSSQGATAIYYTTDGTNPDSISGQLYTLPILVDSTVVLRAIAFGGPGMLPSITSVQNYLVGATHTVPTIFLTTDPLNLWNYQTGIYVYGPSADSVNFPYFGSNFWRQEKKQAHVSYFDTLGNEVINQDITVAIHGGWSKGFSQKGFRIRADGNSGESDFNYKFFASKDVAKFKTLNIRNAGNDWNLCHMRDDVMHNAINTKTNIDYEATQPVVLYLNGRYWGLYHLREHVNEDYAQNNHPFLENQPMDVIGRNDEVLAGDITAFNDLISTIDQSDLSLDAVFNNIATNLDLENIADYFIAETYYTNTDWLSGYTNNIKIWKPKNVPGKWRYMMYDVDFGLGYANAPDFDGLNSVLNNWWYNPHSILLKGLLESQKFRTYFINRYADLMNTNLSSIHILKEVQRKAIELSPEINPQMNRWGNGVSFYGAPSWNDYNGWYNNVLAMADWVAQRPFHARNVVQNTFSLPQQVDIILNVFPADAGRIKISTIIPDSLPWAGVYFDGVPVIIEALPNPGFSFAFWLPSALLPTGSVNKILNMQLSSSDTLVAVFSGSPLAAPISIDEINYHSADAADAGDWFEIKNIGTQPLELEGYKLTTNNYNIPMAIDYPQALAPGARLVIANDSLKFKAIYPMVTNVCYLNFSLNNKVDTIAVYTPDLQVVLKANYVDTMPWPVGADGLGYTMQLIADSLVPNLSSSWTQGCLLGSPGSQYIPCNPTLSVSEINYHSLQASDAGDWIEIRNTTSIPINLSGYTIFDESNLNEFKFDQGTVLLPGQHIVLSSDTTLFRLQHSTSGILFQIPFALGNGGDQIRIFNASQQPILAMQYDDENGWPLAADGQGPTLELQDSTKSLSNPQNWFVGCDGGSPFKYFTPCSTTAVLESGAKLSPRLYPNPTSDQVILQLAYLESPMVYTILDMEGRMLSQAQINALQTNIDLQELAAGVYTVVLTNTEQYKAVLPLLIVR